jgi:hypothetical protein
MIARCYLILLTVIVIAGFCSQAFSCSARVHPPRCSKANSERLVIGPEIRLGGDANRSQWEASLVVSRKDPKHLLVSCMVDPRPDPLRFLRPREKRENHTCMTFSSADGGTTWKRYEFSGRDGWDPVVAFGADGSPIVVYLYLGAGNQLSLHQSKDFGESWGPNVQLSAKRATLDHPMIVADHTKGKFHGRVYIGVYDIRNGVILHHSVDNCASFSAVVAVPHWRNKHAYVHNLLVLSDGTLFIPLAEVVNGTAAYSSVISTDGGETFGKPRKMTDRIVTVNHGPHGVTNVVTGTGVYKGKDRIYALWSGLEPGQARKPTAHARMRFIHSDDAGETWSKARELFPGVAEGIEHGACNIAVSWDGIVGVSWLSHQANGTYDAWFSASLDGGESFLAPVKLSTESSRVLSGQERPYPGDDYLLMDAGPKGGFHVIWPDARTGSAYQIYTRKVQVRR